MAKITYPPEEETNSLLINNEVYAYSNNASQTSKMAIQLRMGWNCWGWLCPIDEMSKNKHQL
jgi:hypothetical protein